VPVSGNRYSHATAELASVRTRELFQAVPLIVAGVEALGRPFTSPPRQLIIKCQRAAISPKHYVLKNMWVSLEVPHPGDLSSPPPPPAAVCIMIPGHAYRSSPLSSCPVADCPGNPGHRFSSLDWFAFPDGRASS